ncbi:MAG: TetR/AcrR family transcriptional regulator C-terminal domain-containing protein [Oscillospiraceae bacterium]|nr:TetR/AcrR family transcriptional regulator C-terminal domain-containing protein [Oscillospiraceae bacterium]
MASSTKEALSNALKKMLNIKPIDKITVKDLVEECGVNRQTFYYHFDDVYDLLEWVFEEDANRVLPDEIFYDEWRVNVMKFFRYLYDNKTFVLNIYNSQNRSYMLRYFKRRMHYCIHGFAVIVAEGRNIEWSDLEFICEFYAQGMTGLISQWLDLNMELPPEITVDKFMQVLDGSIESMLSRFQKN